MIVIVSFTMLFIIHIYKEINEKYYKMFIY